MVRMTRIVIFSAAIGTGLLITPVRALPVPPTKAMHGSSNQQQQNDIARVGDVAIQVGEQPQGLERQAFGFGNVSNPISLEPEVESTSLNLPGDTANMTRVVADRQFLGASAAIPSPLGDGGPTAHVVPLPTAAWTGLSTLALLGCIRFCRNYRKILT